MKLSTLLSFGVLPMTLLALPEPKPELEELQSMSGYAAAMRRDEDGAGFTHLARDGVLRTMNANGSVLDFRRLSQRQLQHLTKTMKRETIDAVTGVDGRDVSLEDALNPKREVLDLPTRTVEERSTSVKATTPFDKRDNCDDYSCIYDLECSGFAIPCKGCNYVPMSASYCLD